MTEVSSVHVVSHTHWDREWYQSAGQFRQRLVALVDELIDSPLLSRPGASFLLDGQTAAIEDYLSVRRERAAELVMLLKSGMIEAGPWYVLADELIPGGEALVRNLLAGRRTLKLLRAFDTSPRVLYCPDSFGHPAALPALARGFGFGTIIAWRGFGSSRWPQVDTCEWIAPGGESVALYHLSRSGYELGANLPADRAAAKTRWTDIRAELLSRNTNGIALLLNGADHHARQRQLDEAVAALTEAAAPDEVKAGSLGGFAAEVEARGMKGLPAISGELRDSYGFTWSISGTLATRAHQKRKNAQLERELLRDVEPWAALASRKTPAPARRQLVETAWRSLLLSHPHDTLCGCSIDEVARAMDTRLEETASQASGLRAGALNALIGHDEDDARERRDDWKPAVIVRNRAARARSGVALVRLTQFVSDVAVGPGSARHEVEVSPHAKRTPAVADFAALQVLSKSEAHERTESPRHYPDDDLVVAYDAVAWIPEVPAYGVRSFAQTSRNRPEKIPNPAGADRASLTNGRIRIRVDDAGRVQFTDIAARRSVPNLLQWESRVDLGDTYTPSIREDKLKPKFLGARVTHRGPVRASIEMKWEFRAKKERVQASVVLMVDADAPWLRIHVAGKNSAGDHRLRLRIATDVANARVMADAMFGPVERNPVIATPDEVAMETPPLTAPLHRYVSLFGASAGATVFSDGLAEYEADDDGAIAITLLRSVGELSRGDIPERPGHAGWPSPTPGAQCHGAFAAELAVMLHGPSSAATIDSIERAADDILLPLTGATLRSALGAPATVQGISLEGEGLAFSCAKESEDGQWLVLRCVNLLDEPRTGSWRIGTPVTEKHIARLDETIVQTAPGTGENVNFLAGPRAIVTILVR
ncbi:MAG TPA: glycoside hydrolase family 38 C-terminal domain-containing protein [Gemmatimonadaceae bacterium]|nr:glycoside hydrolase family 38 C-terminal domain-containing protein [Gemmatimonadaceae bacterium]